MKAEELRKLSESELTEKLGELREELFKLRMQHATAQLEKTARIPEVKRSVARVLTILKEKGAK